MGFFSIFNFLQCYRATCVFVYDSYLEVWLLGWNIRTFIFNRYCQKLLSIYTSSKWAWGYLFSFVFTYIWHYHLLDFLPVRLRGDDILLWICMSQISMSLSFSLYVYWPFCHLWISHLLSFACFSVASSHKSVYGTFNCNRHLKSLMESNGSLSPVTSAFLYLA